MEELFQLLTGLGFLSVNLKEDLQRILVSRHFAINSFMVEPGHINGNIYYILEGSIRIFKLRPRSDGNDEQEINKCFLFEGDFMGSIHSHRNRIVGEQYIQALKPCNVLVTSIIELEKIFKKHPEFYNHAYAILSKYATKCDKISDMLRLPFAVDRYQFVQEHFPQLITKRISQKHLASFMGIDESTLSKIKPSNGGPNGAGVSPSHG
jgi:CRP-like cAMP-binding protein